MRRDNGHLECASSHFKVKGIVPTHLLLIPPPPSVQSIHPATLPSIHPIVTPSQVKNLARNSFSKSVCQGRGRRKRREREKKKTLCSFCNLTEEVKIWDTNTNATPVVIISCVLPLPDGNYPHCCDYFFCRLLSCGGGGDQCRHGSDHFHRIASL